MNAGPRVALAEIPVPASQTRPINMWRTYISPELERVLRTNPGKPFALVDPDTTRLLTIPYDDYNALYRMAKRPFRVQARSAQPGSGKRKADRHVWVSFDPDHWAQHAKRQKEAGQ